MKLQDIILIDPETLGGTPVFKGSRVPVWSLFVHLEKGISLDDFPSVERSQIVGLLEIIEQIFSSEKLINQFYESAALR